MRNGHVKICRVQSRVCIGGPAHHTILLSKRLDPDRFETVLIGGASEPGEVDLLDQAAGQGVKTVRIPEMHRRVNLRDDMKAFRKLCGVFKREKPDIVHTHTAKAGALGRLAARTCGVPIVLHTFHGHVLDGYFSKVVNSCFRQTEKALARMTDKIIVISDSQRRELSEIYHIAKPEKFRTISLGLELNRYLDSNANRGRLRSEIGPAGNAPLLGWVGRFAEIKDPSLLLQVFASLEGPIGKSAHLVLVGDGDLRPQLEKEARDLGISSRVHFLGYRSDLSDIYPDLDLFVLTSRNEGTPVAMIEAMSAGLPVVAPAVGGVEDVARGYPLARIVKDRSTETFAITIEKALKSRGQRADGRPVAERFGAERLVREVEELYESTLTEKRISVKEDREPATRAA